MSTPQELREEARALRAAERIRTKLADGRWVPHYFFTNVEQSFLESVKEAAALGLEKRPLFEGSRRGDWRLARGES